MPLKPIILRETMSEQKLEVTAYLKTYCGWSEGVRAVMKKHEIGYEEKDIIENPAFRWEMEQKSGQSLSPCVVVNGEMLADVSGDEVEAYLLEKQLVGTVDKEAGVPTDRGCSDEQHAAMDAAAMQAQPGKIRIIED